MFQCPISSEREENGTRARVRSAPVAAYAVWFVVGGPSGGTLAHEIGHALLHEPFDNRALAELEAESTAYVI